MFLSSLRNTQTAGKVCLYVLAPKLINSFRQNPSEAYNL